MKGARERLSKKKRLRSKTGSRPIVVVGIVEVARVELDLVVVELEVRRVDEVAIGVWNLSLSI